MKVSNTGFDSINLWKSKRNYSATKEIYIEYFVNKYKEMENEGKIINWIECQNSIDAGWPYPVATRAEKSLMFREDHQPMQGHAIDILNLLRFYKKGKLEEYNNPGTTIYKDDDKIKFWKDILIRGAEDGNREFQAALICSLGVYGGVFSGWLTSDEEFELKKKYEKKLIEDAAEKNGEAMFAVAQFCIGDVTSRSYKRIDYTEAAMKVGLGDAAYLRAEIYKNNSYWEGELWDNKKVLDIYLKGIKTNNGAMLGTMLYYVAFAYRNGEHGFPIDEQKYKYYYDLAMKNKEKNIFDKYEVVKA